MKHIEESGKHEHIHNSIVKALYHLPIDSSSKQDKLIWYYDAIKLSISNDYITLAWGNYIIEAQGIKQSIRYTGKICIHIYNITSSGEKKATASRSIEPAGYNDTTALKAEGKNNSITATLSVATSPREPGFNLFKPWKVCSFSASTGFSLVDDGSEGLEN